jgi:hypothetical protein
MAVTKIRKWCEDTAKEFGCKLTHSGKEWAVIQLNKKENNPKIVFRATTLVEAQNYFLNEIHKYLGKRMGVIKK